MVEVSAGRAHLVVLTNNEGAFTLGDNSYGQCGRRVIENEDYKRAAIIHNIKKIKGEKITNIESGQDHRFVFFVRSFPKLSGIRV